MNTTSSAPDQLQLLAIEEADAWFEYLEAVRTARTTSPARYAEVEPWAWTRLQQRRRAVAAKRRKLEDNG